MIEVDEDEDFLRINREITRNFVNLYLQNDPDIQTRSPEERERSKASVQRLQQTPDQISLQVQVYNVLQLNLFTVDTLKELSMLMLVGVVTLGGVLSELSP